MKNENIIHQTIRFNRNDPSDMALLSLIDRLKRQGLIGSFNDAAKTALKEKYAKDHDWAAWDNKIEEDVSSGSLDFLMQEALDEKSGGKLRNL